MLGLVAAADDEIRYELGREETVLDDSWHLGQPRRERTGIVHGARVVGDDAPVRTAGGVTDIHRADPRECGGEAEI